MILKLTIVHDILLLQDYQQPAVYTVSTQKQSQRIFNIILFRLMKFYKIWRNISRVYSGHNCSCTSNKACVIPLAMTFYFIAELKHRLCQLNAESAHGGHFEHILCCFHGSVC